MKKISLLFLLCCFISFNTYSTNNPYDGNVREITDTSVKIDEYPSVFDGMDGFDIDTILSDPYFNDFLDKNSNLCLSAKFDPAGILEILVHTLNILSIAQQDLYFFSYPLNKRNIVDNAAFYPFVEAKRDRLIGVQPFFNQTSRMNFTRTSDAIRSYLNICSETLLDEINKSIKAGKDIGIELGLDPMNLFPLFGVMTIQDRQLGIMVHVDKFYKKYHLHVHAPLLYRERNFYMTPEEQKDIEKVLAPSTGNESDTTFQDQHLICDKFGIGDTRITFEWPVYKFQKMTFYGGVLATLPTAVAFQKGLKGASFEKSQCDCDFSIAELWDLADNKQFEQASKIGTDLLLSSLDRLAYVLLDTGLGLDKHVGLGAYFHTKARLSSYISKSWARNVTYRGRTSIEYHLPATEDRLFKQIVDPSDYEEDKFDTEDPIVALCKLNFLTQRIIEKLCPFKVPTWVSPGITFRWISSVAYQSGRWTVAGLSDFWYKGKESVEIKHRGSQFANSLNIKAGTRPYALQSKLGAYFSYTREEPTYVWTVGLYGDAAYWTEGIGNDFTLALNITGHF